LKPHLSGAGCLAFDQRQELTTFKSGYFWEKLRPWRIVCTHRARRMKF
jgi:hypothetical protein